MLWHFWLLVERAGRLAARINTFLGTVNILVLTNAIWLTGIGFLWDIQFLCGYVCNQPPHITKENYSGFNLDLGDFARVLLSLLNPMP